MTSPARWRARLNRANAQHVGQLERVLRREFRRLLKEIDLKRPLDAVRDHAIRLNAILGAHKRATAHTFGFMALEMLALYRSDVKSDGIGIKADESAPSRAEQVAAILLELARTVAIGAVAALIAEALSRDRQIVAAVEGAILSAADPAPSAIATTLLQNRHVASRLAVAHAIATGAEIAPQGPGNANAGQFGGGGGGEAPPSSSPPSGEGPPPRSRFSVLVEKLVREEAPVRARIIARSSGNTIAQVLAQGAREGWGENRTRQELQRRLYGIHGEVADYRARAIARTELGAAQNAATLALAQDRAAAGSKLEKVWVAIDDRRTRETHAEADDQVRPIAEPFSVGRHALMHPGDPSAPLGEIVNCRCAMLIRRASA